MVLIACLIAPASAAKKPAAPAKKSEPARDAGTGGVVRSDAQWTLYCQAVAGPAHVEQAKAIKDQLMAATKDRGLKDWYVIHQEGESVVYHGYYRTIDGDGEGRDAGEKRDGRRAQDDRKAIGGLMDRQGNRLFEHVFFVQVTAPDPVAPPEWNLLNASGFYTVQIAAYKDSPQRKEAAVQAVRDARAQGIDAYYYHGETTSSVCVGAWPRAAVAGADDDEGKGIVPATSDPFETMLVLPHQTADQDQLKVHDRAGGQRIRTYAPTLRPIDPSLIATMQKYPTHAVNGVVYQSKVEDPVTKELKVVEDPSYVVEIPKPAASLLRQQAAAPELIAPPTPTHATQGGGKLKSLGDR